jgi:transcriptional regulator with XRE-family HTH domain
MDTFGSRLRQYRERKGMQIGVLAKRLGVSTQYLDDVERGKRKPLTPARINQVGDILQLNLAEMEFLFLQRALEHGSFEIPYSYQETTEDELAPLRNRTAARLQAAWESLTPEQLDGIQDVLRGFPLADVKGIHYPVDHTPAPPAPQEGAQPTDGFDSLTTDSEE